MSARWLLPLLFVGPSLASGCVCGHEATPADLAKRTFGDLASEKVELATYVALARALVMGGAESPQVAPPTHGLPPSPGRRVFLTVFRRHAPRVVSTGLGETLEASVVAAAHALPKGDARADDAGDTAFRVQLDVVDTVTPVKLDDDVTTSWGDLGMTGYAVTIDGSQIGYVLPSELLLDRDFEEGSGKSTKIPVAKIMKSIDARGNLDHEDGTAFGIRTRSYVDASSGSGAVELRRGTVLSAREVNPELLLDSVRLGADYLSRSLDANGRYAYRYRPTDDHVATEYGMLRHAGSTYALLEAYDELKVPLYLEKAEAALAYAEAHLSGLDDHGKHYAYIVDTNDEEQQKAGGAGLLLLALAKHAEITGSKSHLALARSLAGFIVHQQYPDGHLRANRDVEAEAPPPDGARLKTELLYYPGEAILGLLRLFRVDPDPAWLDAAKKGADYCVHVRDASVPVETQEHDHWLSYALNDLYRITPDAAYLEHAEKIAHAILLKQKTGHDAPANDFVGSFYSEAPSTPASTRLEAFASDVELERYAKRPDDWLLKPATAVAKFTRAQQLDPDRVFFARDPVKALGGVRESLFVEDIRIDYVQHAVSGWIHLARELRDPAYVGRGAPPKGTDKP
jgi:hypothetical protein